ncbi:RNA polymerase II transcription elongation factor Rtf1p [Cladophialophora carrionii]|uniref:RNA polymerase II transcription elongation factor Rtf1p n=1 Tax=Cladophialophora carrionii TaxID=86049 RepID=A0A1C1CGI2_9EURO|nr:RNA polymerase II transcription elongation factor Rtf1p [Cladophialophora carrionii]
MADLDAELLALAGGDSSGEESMPSSPKEKSSSPPRSKKQSRDSPPTEARKGVAKTVKRTKRRKTYSDDEDEVSSLSQHSESASMSQSDSEADFGPDTDDKPIFPYEKLYYDAADKARIEAKPEIEREEILAQRSEQVERHEQDLTLRRLVAQRAREEAKNAAKNKRKASAADLEDSQRKSTRQRTKVGGGRVGEASSAIEAYKRQREEKNLRDEQRKRGETVRRLASPRDNFSDADAEGESDNDYDDRRYKRRSPSPPKDEPVAELQDIQRARVGRDNFAQVCYTPGFKETITGCYARVCLGPGRTPGVNEYRLCLIKGFATGKPYAMIGSNGRPFPVDMYIIAAHGKAEKQWSFLECSMQKFTDAEWLRYRSVMANDDLKMPTKAFINSKLDQINRLINHRFTDTDISARIKAQADLTEKITRAGEKADLRERIAEARADGRDELAEELENQLAAIVPMKLAFGTSLEKKETSYVNPEQERLAELNRRNQRLNAENVRKAQLAEMRQRKAKKTLAPGIDDLFEGGSDISRAGTPVNGAGTPKLGPTLAAAASISRTASPNPLSLANGTPRSSTPLASGALKPVLSQQQQQKKKGGLPTIRKAALDDEIIAQMDLGIDIDIDV